MENTSALHTHVWSDGTKPHQIKQDGQTIFHHRCLRCGRDFAQGFGVPDWQGAYVGAVRIELLTEKVSDRWRREECPGRLLPDDDEFRAMRRS